MLGVCQKPDHSHDLEIDCATTASVTSAQSLKDAPLSTCGTLDINPVVQPTPNGCSVLGLQVGRMCNQSRYHFCVPRFLLHQELAGATLHAIANVCMRVGVPQLRELLHTHYPMRF